MKIILVMGLPGAGKTTLADEMAPLLNAKRLNADEVRKAANDWDFSEEGRVRQAKRMPVAPYLDFKWKSWQKGSVGASEMEAATLFTVSQIKRIEAGAILAIETSDKETIKKMTEIVLESITYMERERNVN